MNRKNTQVKITKSPFELLARKMKTPGTSILIIMLLLSLSVVSCDTEKERQRDKVQVLNSYNRAIDDFHQRSTELWMTFDHTVIVGYNMEQTLWELVREDHKLDSVEQAFLNKHGEHELSLLISDNFDRKMRK